MKKEHVLERYLDSLLKGDRNACRAVIEETLQSGVPANSVYMDVIWPVMVEIDKLYRNNTIDSVQEAFATRINRTIVDQLQNKLPRKIQRFRRIVICSANSQNAELGAQMVTDLFESDGWETRFLGGTVNNDDILAFVHTYRPDILLLYGIEAKDAPRVRLLIDSVKTINAFPEMQIMLSGGVFARAESLWEEIGADLFAENATDAVRLASADTDKIPTPQRTIKRRKKSYSRTELSPVVETIPT
jgi:methanogenic corrinoid protein MtbC1